MITRRSFCNSRKSILEKADAPSLRPAEVLEMSADLFLDIVSTESKSFIEQAERDGYVPAVSDGIYFNVLLECVALHSVVFWRTASNFENSKGFFVWRQSSKLQEPERITGPFFVFIYTLITDAELEGSTYSESDRQNLFCRIRDRIEARAKELDRFTELMDIGIHGRSSPNSVLGQHEERLCDLIKISDKRYYPSTIIALMAARDSMMLALKHHLYTGILKELLKVII
jgi:hypothetical protein